jgi:small subunit ribosomal protein S16
MKPFYRVVLVENEKKMGGKPVELLGFWNPRENTLQLDKEQIKSWVEKGAQPTKKIKELLAR